MILNKLKQKELIHPPSWLIDNCQYLTIMGSKAYGCSDDNSDLDIYGWTIPPKNMIFPHLRGEIMDFGTQKERFHQWQEHHIIDKEQEKEYDFSVYSIIKYFQLVMENNPNMIDSLFVPRMCILHMTKIGEHVRENRRMFLHKGSWFKFKGYAYSQLSKIKNKSNASNPDRNKSIQEHGYDIKFAYHLVRLLNEVEQILVEQDLNLLKNREQLKSIRRGEWSFEQIQEYFQKKELILEETYSKSTLRECPDENEIKKLLLGCLEEHYGSLTHIIKIDTKVEDILDDLQKIINRNKKGK